MELYRQSHYLPPTLKHHQILYLYIPRESRSNVTFRFHMPAHVSNPRPILNMHRLYIWEYVLFMCPVCEAKFVVCCAEKFWETMGQNRAGQLQSTRGPHSNT
jgi:hypothetical protein